MHIFPRTIILATAITWLFPSTGEAQDSWPDYTALRRIDATNVRAAGITCDSLNLGNLNALLNGFDNIRNEELRLRSAMTFAFSGGSAPESESNNGARLGRRTNQMLSMSLALQRGYYPSDFSLRSGFQMQMDDSGQFSEDVLDIHISYDRQFPSFGRSKNYAMEAFVFSHRYDDRFLSIDSRYEVGLGAIINARFGLTDEGHKQATTTRWGVGDVSGAGGDGEWLLDCKAVESCFNKMMVKGGDDTAFATILSEAERARNLAEEHLSRRFSVLRLALMAGILRDIEQATISIPRRDSMLLVPTSGENALVLDDDKNIEIQPDSGWRLEFRPTIQYRPVQNVSLRMDYYVKYGFAGFRASPSDTPVRKPFGLLGRSHQEVRTNFLAAINFSMDNAVVTLSYNRLTDGAPPYASSDTAPGSSAFLGKQVIYARSVRDQYRMSFTLKF